MGEEDFLRSFGIIVIAAAAFVMAGRAIRMPAIVVYLIAGVVIGPVLGIVKMNDALGLVSHTGIALLLFLVGLELSFSKIKKVGAVALAAGLGQVLFTVVGGFALCWMLGFPLMESVFLATALTFSSTVVVVKLLDEKGELDTLYGRIAVGIFLVQDLVAIVILTFLAGLAGQKEMDFTSVSIGLVKAFGGMGALLTLALLASRYLLPRPFKWAARSAETLLIWALSWCFLLVLAAHAFGLSMEVGAFLAGLSLAQLPYNDDLRRRVHPLMNLFIAIFFVSLGIGMEFGDAGAGLWKTVILSLFVLIGNPFIFLIIILRMGYSTRTSFFTSVTVAQISEFSFIFAGMGVAAGLIGNHILSMTALIGVITIALSAYMIRYSEALFRLAERCGLLRWRIFRPRPSAADEQEIQPLAGHIIIIGMNTLGRALVRRLHAQGETVLAIDTDPAKLDDLPGQHLLGNVEYLSVLDEANMADAKLLVTTLHIEDTNNLIAFRCRAQGVPCAVNVFDLSLADDLLDLDVAYLIVPKVEGVRAQLQVLRELGHLEKPKP
jgi:Kef-type K+ transport system membrane component KefB